MAAWRRCLITSGELRGAGGASLSLGTPRSTSMAQFVHKLLHSGMKQQQRQCLVRNRFLRIVPIDAAHASFKASDNPGVLYSELTQLSRIQLGLAMEGIYLAGVVTMGEVLDVPDIFVGPGVTRAERRRDEWASAPRLVIDPDLLRELAADPRLLDQTIPISDEYEHIRDFLNRDSNGLWYLDYLYGCWSPGPGEKSFGVALHKHKEVLALALAAAKTTRSMAVQLSWLRRYHNRSVRQLAKYAENGLIGGLSKDELLISARSSVEYRF